MSKFLLQISKRVVHAQFFGELGTIRSMATYKPYLTLGERLTSNPSALCASAEGGGGCWGNDPVDGKPRPSKKDKSRSKPKKQSNKKKTKRKSKTALCERLDENVDSYCGNKFADVNSSVMDPCGTKADVSDKTASADSEVDGKDSNATNTSVSRDEPKEEVSIEKTTDVKLLDEKAVCAEVCNKKSADSKMDVCYTQSADSVYDQKSKVTNVVCKHRSDDSKVDTCYTQSADPCACDKNSSESTEVKVSNEKTSNSKVEDSKNPDHSTVNCFKKDDEGRKDSKELKSSANEEPCSCTKIVASAEKEPNEIPSPLLFRKMEEGELGPEISKTGTYQNPEYFSYTKWSFYDAMIGLARVSCPQPSNKMKS